MIRFSSRHFHDETGQLTKDLHLDAGRQSFEIPSKKNFLISR